MNRRVLLATTVAILLSLGGCQKANDGASSASASAVNDTPPLTLETTTSTGAGAQVADAGSTTPGAPAEAASAPAPPAAAPAPAKSPVSVAFNAPAKGQEVPLAYAQASPDDGAPRIPIAKVEELLGKNAAIVVDVRSPAAYQFEHAAGAINIPENELPRKLEKLPKDKLIVLYCT